MSLRILHVYKKFSFTPVGGIEQSIKQYSFALNKYYKCKNTVIYIDQKPNIKKKKYLTAICTKQIGEISSCGIPDIFFFKNFFEQQKKNDVIIFHYPFPIQDLTLVFGLINKPYFIYYHSDIVIQKKLSYLYIPFRYLFFKYAKKIFISSRNYIKVSDVLPKYKDKIKEIKLFLNKELIVFRKKKIKLKYFLFIGQYRHYKNISNIVKAFSELPQYNLVMIGVKKKQLINENIAPNITLIDYVTDREKYNLIYNCMAIILVSSNKAEAFGYALLEGLFLKKPLISSKLPTGIKLINDHMKTGIVIKKISVKAIVRAINSFVKNLKKFKKKVIFKNKINIFKADIISKDLYSELQNKN